MAGKRSGSRRRDIGPAGGGGRSSPPGLSDCYDASWAVVIGVNEYGAVPKLECAVADAEAVAAALPALGFDPGRIVRLIDADATKQNIQDVLSADMAKRTGPDDRLLVFFAGHGQDIETPSRKKMGYLLPVDVDPERLASRGVSMGEIETWGELIPAKHILFVFDCCYSGLAATREAGLDPLRSDYVAEVMRHPVRQIITAGRADERVIEESGQGVFTRVLLRGLKGDADLSGKGFVTGFDLGHYVTDRVYEESHQHQQPMFRYLSGDGEFIVPATSRAPVPQELTSRPVGGARETAIARPDSGANAHRRVVAASLIFALLCGLGIASYVGRVLAWQSTTGWLVLGILAHLAVWPTVFLGAMYLARKANTVALLGPSILMMWVAAVGVEFALFWAFWDLDTVIVTLPPPPSAHGSTGPMDVPAGILAGALAVLLSVLTMAAIYKIVSQKGCPKCGHLSVRTAGIRNLRPFDEEEYVTKENGTRMRRVHHYQPYELDRECGNCGWACTVRRSGHAGYHDYSVQDTTPKPRPQVYPLTATEDRHLLEKEARRDVEGAVSALMVGKGSREYLELVFGRRLDLWRQAAEAGLPEGQWLLGRCSEEGLGVEKNPDEAVRLYRKAAEQGHAAAQNSLGVCYENGYGVPRDRAEAVNWYRRAAEQGSVVAQHNLGVCYAYGKGVGEDMAEAVKWFRKAAEQGYAAAQYMLGLCYAHGKGVGEDMAEAVKWFRKAAEQGDKNAKYALEHLERPKSGCWVSTAVSGALGWADDSRELNALRRLRDSYMQETPERRAEVERYYEVAPRIVEAVNSRPDARAIWKDVAERHILPVVRAAERGDAEEAHRLCKAMVEELEARWLGAGSAVVMGHREEGGSGRPAVDGPEGR